MLQSSVSGKKTNSITLICSYSFYRAHILTIFISQFKKEFPDGIILLLAYDKTHPDLKSYTVGERRGDRLPNLRLLAELAETKYLLSIDDDVYITHGNLTLLVETFKREKNVILIQPALDKRGYYTFPINLSVFSNRFKNTGFVEAGPALFCEKKSFSELFIDKFDPRGVGIEWYWSRQFAKQYQIGIHYGVRILHCIKPGSNKYPKEGEFLQRVIKNYHIKNFPPNRPEVQRILIRFIEKFLDFSRMFTVDNSLLKNYALFNPRRVYFFSFRRLFFYLPCHHLANDYPFKLLLLKKCPECKWVLSLSNLGTL